jgi:hypothetical protein
MTDSPWARHRECSCGDDYGEFGEADEDECDAPCSGDSTQMCGGGWRNSIWEITGVHSDGQWSDWKAVPQGADAATPAGADAGSIECSVGEVAPGSDPAPGRRKTCQCSVLGDGTDAASCGKERGSRYPYPGCQNCDGGQTGNKNGQGGGYTCECVGANAKVRMGIS